tara:strand:+ start:242 stop:1378 length:1137 start_codon:yes stop_codon:yes gene_type:complete
MESRVTSGAGFVNEVVSTNKSTGVNGIGVKRKGKKNRNKKNKKAKRRKLAQEAARRQKVETPEEVEKREADEAVVAEYAASLERGRAGTLSDRLNAKHQHYDEPFQLGWKKLGKKSRAAIVTLDRDLREAARAAVKTIRHPFKAERDDHCETDPMSYYHIAPLLELVARRLGKTAATLKIYDPFFCAGAVKRHMGALGFESVHNENHDFYAMQTRSMIPEHDVVVTNPPFSGDHVERLLKWCRANGKPFLLLMPNYVVGKAFYADAIGRDDLASDGSEYVMPLLVVPRKRYNFWTPKGMRGKPLGKGKKGKVQSQHTGPHGTRTSPFVTFWYVDLHPTCAREETAALCAAVAEERGIKCYAGVEDLPSAIRDDDEVRS